MRKIPLLVVLLIVVLTGLGCSSDGRQSYDSEDLRLPPEPMRGMGIHGHEEIPWPSEAISEHHR